MLSVTIHLLTTSSGKCIIIIVVFENEMQTNGVK